MTTESFESILRQFLRRQPFQPFVVELTDGRQISIDCPQLAIGGGGASMLTPEYSLVEFSSDEVRDIHLATQETAT